jgi:hypothetical protein
VQIQTHLHNLPKKGLKISCSLTTDFDCNVFQKEKLSFAINSISLNEGQILYAG